MADDLVDTPRVRQIVGAARRDAAERGHRHLGVEHLMLAILDDGASVAAHAIRHSGASFDDIRNYIEQVMNSDSYQPPPPATGHRGEELAAAGADLAAATGRHRRRPPQRPC